MAWTFQAPLLALASEFTGKYAPYQSVLVQPHPDTGVVVAATDQGKVAVVGYDPRGEAEEETRLIVGDELARACRAIKTAQREITIDGMNATVRSYGKNTSKSAEFLVQHSTVEFPPLAQVMAQCIERWGSSPAASSSAGRYDASLLERVIKAGGSLADSIVLSAFDGGPLRIQGEGLEILLLLMPQTAVPIPAVPAWAEAWAA